MTDKIETNNMPEQCRKYFERKMKEFPETYWEKCPECGQKLDKPHIKGPHMFLNDNYLTPINEKNDPSN